MTQWIQDLYSPIPYIYTHGFRNILVIHLIGNVYTHKKQILKEKTEQYVAWKEINHIDL